MELKKLGFGMPLADKKDQTKVDIEQVCRMVDAFLEQGFTYFDTAYMYHEYASERIVKEVLVDRHPRESFLLATKLPTMMLSKKEDMERIFNEQLEKCGVEYFDYYLLHCLDTRNYDICKKLGCFEFAMQKEHPEVEFVQLQINYLDWENEYIQSRKCHETAVKYGKDIIVMEPVKGGMLAQIPDKAETLLKNYNAESSIASWAIRYAASLPNVFMVLSGMSSYEQMMDNLSYMKKFQPFTEEEEKLVEQAVDIINTSIAIPCTNCRYCVEGCPKNIPIPEYFKIYNQYARFKEGSRTRGRYRNLTKEYGKASECIACGNCETHCPQSLKIIDYMKEVSAVYDSGL